MRRSSGKGISGRAGGSTTVEMAVVLPLFLLLVFGIFEFGRVWLVVNNMNHASREAVRLAAVTPSLTANDTAVIGRANTILATAGIIPGAPGIIGITVTNTAPPAGPPPRVVAVTIALTYTWITGIGPLYGFSFAGGIPLASSATMCHEPC